MNGYRILSIIRILLFFFKTRAVSLLRILYSIVSLKIKILTCFDKCAANLKLYQYKLYTSSIHGFHWLTSRANRRRCLTSQLNTSLVDTVKCFAEIHECCNCIFCRQNTLKNHHWILIDHVRFFLQTWSEMMRMIVDDK